MLRVIGLRVLGQREAFLNVAHSPQSDKDLEIVVQCSHASLYTLEK